MDAGQMSEVLTAVSTLYGDGNQYCSAGEQEIEEMRMKASEWLEQLQKSVQAWKIADQLLHMKRDVNSCFFAAQTIRTKIQYYFVELPPEAHVSLRASLLDHLSYITDNTYQGIVTQLCVAVADLALLMVTWTDPVGDLIKQFGPGSPTMNLLPLLEVLIALPEEQTTCKVKLGLSRRTQLADYFKSQVAIVIQLLHMLIKDKMTASESIHVKTVRCLCSWFNIHCQQWLHLLDTCILSDLVELVANPEKSSRLHEVATDCMCSAIIMLEVERIPALTTALFAEILQLECAYVRAVAMEDLAAVTNYARIFAELGETIIEVLVNDKPSQGNLHVLHLLLTCVGHHEWEVAEITFNFWYKLSDFLYYKNCNSSTETFKPYIERLIQALYRHCQIDADHENILLEQDDLFEFRDRVQQLVKDVIFICGSRSCFEQMTQILQSPEAQANWNLLEAGLFIMQSVAKKLLPESNDLVPPILEAVLNQPDNLHPQVQYTSMQLIGELSEWLSCHPSVIPSVLTFLTRQLNNPLLATVAAKALDLVCLSCRDHIEEHIDGLMQVMSAIDTFSVSNSAVIRLLKGVTSILSCLPPDKIEENLKTLCMAQVVNLQKVVQGNSSVNQVGCKDPVYWLERLTSIFRSINFSPNQNTRHPCQDVVMEMWPVLSMTFEKYCGNGRVIEHCCKCMRFVMRTIHLEGIPLLQPVVELIVRLYAAHGHSAFLYLGSILVDEYAQDENSILCMCNMLQSFCQPTFSLLSQQYGFRDNPDTVEDFFRMCSRFLQKAPVPFLHLPVKQSILECALQACLLDHKDANSCVMKFFQDLMYLKKGTSEFNACDEKKRLITEILDQHGQTLVDNLVTAAVFVVPRSMLYNVAITLYEVMVFDRAKFCKWLEARLKTLPRHNSGGLQAVTDNQIVELHASLTKADHANSIVHALEDFSRYYT